MIATLVAMMCAGPVRAEKPNVVIIYGDDVGFADVGFGGSKMIPTPNIDMLARGGLIFTDGHCSSSVCSPSRFAMLTGQHPLRIGLSVIAPGDHWPFQRIRSHFRICSKKRAITHWKVAFGARTGRRQSRHCGLERRGETGTARNRV